MPYEVKMSILHEEKTLEQGTYYPGVVRRVLIFQGVEAPGRDILERELRRIQGDPGRSLSFQGGHCTVNVTWVPPRDVPLGPERAEMACAMQGAMQQDRPHDQDLVGDADWFANRYADALEAEGWEGNFQRLFDAIFNGYQGKPVVSGVRHIS
jgi:hypothetical protein